MLKKTVCIYQQLIYGLWPLTSVSTHFHRALKNSKCSKGIYIFSIREMQSQMLIQMHDNEEMTQFPAKTNSSPPIHQTHRDAHR